MLQQCLITNKIAYVNLIWIEHKDFFYIVIFVHVLYTNSVTKFPVFDKWSIVQQWIVHAC